MGKVQVRNIRATAERLQAVSGQAAADVRRRSTVADTAFGAYERDKRGFGHILAGDRVPVLRVPPADAVAPGDGRRRRRVPQRERAS
jgi:hypothetical protein